MKPVLILLLCIWSSILFSQVNQNVENLNLIRVYFAEKEISKPNEEHILKRLKEMGIKQERYANILKAKLSGDTILISEHEKAFITHWQSEFSNSRINELQDVCDAHNVTLVQYQKFKKRYRSDIKFQRTLRPLFEQVMSEK